jgi:hypothetical protein
MRIVLALAALATLGLLAGCSGGGENGGTPPKAEQPKVEGDTRGGGLGMPKANPNFQPPTKRGG